MREVDIAALKEIAGQAVQCSGYIIQCSDDTMAKYIKSTRPSVVLELIRRIEETNSPKPPQPIPCKRCGCKSMSIERYLAQSGPAFYVVRCKSCSIEGPSAIDEETAIKHWNIGNRAD